MGRFLTLRLRRGRPFTQPNADGEALAAANDRETNDLAWQAEGHRSHDVVGATDRLSVNGDNQVTASRDSLAVEDRLAAAAAQAGPVARRVLADAGDDGAFPHAV